MLPKKPVHLRFPSAVQIEPRFWLNQSGLDEMGLDDRFVMLTLIAMADDRGFVCNDLPLLAEKVLGCPYNELRSSIIRLEDAGFLTFSTNPSAISLFSDGFTDYGVSPTSSTTYRTLKRIVERSAERETLPDSAAMVADDHATVHEVARPVAGMSPDAFYRACRSGLIPLGVWWRIGRSIRVSRSKLLAWRESGGTLANLRPATTIDPAAVTHDPHTTNQDATSRSRFITERQLSNELGVSQRTLLDWRNRKIGPAHIRLGPKRIVYERSAVEAYLSNRTRTDEGSE